MLLSAGVSSPSKHRHSTMYQSMDDISSLSPRVNMPKMNFDDPHESSRSTNSSMPRSISQTSGGGSSHGPNDSQRSNSSSVHGDDSGGPHHGSGYYKSSQYMSTSAFQTIVDEM